MDKYWLVSDDNCKGIQGGLLEIINTTPKSSAIHDIAVKALHDLETGMHKCDVKPWDM
jgi:hypothetical protein